MVMVYGTDLCPDCVAVKEAFDSREIAYKYVDITESLGAMKQFLKLRDTHDAFKDIRGNGKIGIPAIIVSASEITLDWQAYIKSVK